MEAIRNFAILNCMVLDYPDKDFCTLFLGGARNTGFNLFPDLSAPNKACFPGVMSKMRMVGGLYNIPVYLSIKVFLSHAMFLIQLSWLR